MLSSPGLSRAPHAHGQETELCAGLYGGQQQKTAMVPSAWKDKIGMAEKSRIFMRLAK
jgi:hypothetical protein